MLIEMGRILLSRFAVYLKHTSCCLVTAGLRSLKGNVWILLTIQSAKHMISLSMKFFVSAKGALIRVYKQHLRPSLMILQLELQGQHLKGMVKITRFSAQLVSVQEAVSTMLHHHKGLF
uniref:Uncharacterized protein MANES_09G167200 n=1 Tax=Rhizophora mucronata TaxID=61149 RepID=A0A2P2ILR1_RHIMU